jgi:hypothetical protein
MTGVVAVGKRRGAGRPPLTDEQAAAQAVRIIEVALTLHREGASAAPELCARTDAELLRRFNLTRNQAVALIYKRQRHPKVAAFVGDSVENLFPSRKQLEGAARLALALKEANPRLSLTAAIRRAARCVAVEAVHDGDADPASGRPKRTVTHKALDETGVRRAVEKLRGE